MWRKQFGIEHKIFVQAPAAIVWRHVTEVDIASFHHPAYFSLLGIPKPLRAEITKSGVGGRRVAYFDNGRTFTQAITVWQPPKRYDITFQADPGFRAGYLLDLANGPFQMVSGSYRMALAETGVTVGLASQYELRAFLAGFCICQCAWCSICFSVTCCEGSRPMQNGRRALPRGTVSVVVEGSCTAVFNLIHDYGRRLAWDTLLRKAMLLDGATEAGLGVRSLCVGSWRGAFLPLETEYIRFAPGENAAVSLTNRPPFFNHFAATIRHEPLGENRSRVTYIYYFQARPRFLAPILEPLMNWLLKRETQKRLLALQRCFVNMS